MSCRYFVSYFSYYRSAFCLIVDLFAIAVSDLFFVCSCQHLMIHVAAQFYNQNGQSELQQ